MRVAYLVNQYPKVSHTFIRREILALEALGVAVVRIAVRGWTEVPVDQRDQDEQRQTTYVLRAGAMSLLFACWSVLLSVPSKFFRALGDAFSLSRGGDRPLWVYFIYLCEACWIKRHLETMAKRGHAVDHLHAHFGTNPAAIALLVRSIGGPPYSFTVHGPEEFDRPHALKLEFKAERAKGVVAISAYGRSQLFRWLALNDWSKVAVVRCGLEASYFNSSQTLLTGRAKRAMPNSLLCIGRLSEQKGHLVLIEAAAMLHERGVHCELIFAGDGELRNDIERRIDEAGIRSKVRITGWISSDQVQAEIAQASGIVVPSFAEGLPVVIMEAMAMEKPVISTYVAGIPELVQHGETGWLVPAGDSTALADAMQDLLTTSEEALQKMGRAGKVRVVQAHSITRSASELVILFGPENHRSESSKA
jgi:colanic acid/amylovoran biosynthesis glycosyltransferase